MKILTENPPYNIRALCEELFDLTYVKPVWTYGQTLYNPHRQTIDRALARHEETHSKRQGEHPAKWWDSYFQEDMFRFTEELAAYREQYKIAKEDIKDRNQLNEYLYSIACDLSSEMYGNICTKSQAQRLIKDCALSLTDLKT